MAASFISSQARNVACWYIAPFRCLAEVSPKRGPATSEPVIGFAVSVTRSGRRGLCDLPDRLSAAKSCWSSLRANGSRECAPDDRLREAIQLGAAMKDGRRFAPRNDRCLPFESQIGEPVTVSSSLRAQGPITTAALVEVEAVSHRAKIREAATPIGNRCPLLVLDVGRNRCSA